MHRERAGEGRGGGGIGYGTDRVSLVQTTGVGGKGVCLLGLANSSNQQSTLVFLP